MLRRAHKSTDGGGSRQPFPGPRPNDGFFDACCGGCNATQNNTVCRSEREVVSFSMVGSLKGCVRLKGLGDS